MSYAKLTDFASKDALLTGNPSKLIRGTELGAEFDAIQVADALNIKPDTVTAATGKTTPVDADLFTLFDSASTFSLKKLTWANLKATIKTYFDTIYVLPGDNTTLTSLGNNTSTIYTTAGTATAFTITPTPVISAYAAGQSFVVKFNAANGAAPTLQISGIATPPNLVKENSDGTFSNLAAGDIPINHRSRVTLISTTQALVESMRFATTAEAQALSTASAYLSPAGLAAALQGSNQSLSTSGYQKFPGGLILQWGYGTAGSAAAGTSTTITLPVTYVTSNYGAFAVNTGTVASNSTYNTTAVNSSSFTVQRGNNGNSESGVNFYWISVGK